MGRPVTQFQILAKDPDRLSAFYVDLFGWTVDSDNPLGYRRFTTGAGRGIDGGMWPSPPDGHSFVQLFVEVDDLAATLAEATRLGAMVLLPPQTLPEGEQMALIRDPEGIPVALFRPKPA